MHVIAPHEPSVTLFSDNGGVWHYASKAQALRELGIRWIREHVAADFRVFSHFEYGPSFFRGEVYSCSKKAAYRTSTFVLRDDAGNKLTAADLQPLLPPRRGWYLRYLDNYPGYGPVPRSGRRRGGRYFRRPKSTNERRQAQVMEPDIEPAPRPGRNASNLANAWDDYPRRSSREDRNWKRFRKTRWKTPR